MNDEMNREELIAAVKESEVEPIAPTEEGQISRMFSIKELISALVSYVAAWVYVHMIVTSGEGYKVYAVLFGVIFSVSVLVFYRENLRKKEHWVWLVCLWVCLICEIIGRNQVWDGSVWLFIHCFAIYWVLCLSGHMMEGESSAYLLLDALHGAITYPFKHLLGFLRTQVLWWGVCQARPGKKKKSGNLIYVIFAVCLALILFLVAGKLLVQADANFGSFLENFRIELDFENFSKYFWRFIYSLPVGAYLYGLVVGTNREAMERLTVQKNGIQTFLNAIRKVPNGVWLVLTGAFVVFYLMFFGVQGSYLFGAFARNLPEGFTVAEYARQGFFELCGIMGLNFCLLWLVCYSSVSPVREKKSSKIMCTVLLAESILFAVTAMSKLILYIDCFGFTPLRLQSFWGVTVLMMGCVCSIVSLWSGKKTARVWILFTGITLAVLHVY